MRTKHLLSKLMLLLAVMLTGAGTAWAEEVTIASFNHDSNEGWTITNADYATATGGYYKLISSDASIVTPSIAWSNYSDITITITARKFGGPDTTQGKISVSQGDTELTSYSPSSTSNVASSALSISPIDETITISCPGASNSKGCGVQSIVIKGKEKASVSPLASIALSGDYPTSFFVDNTFSHEGMTVTATYEDETTKDVTSKAEFSGYNMATVSNSQTVTVSYTEGDVTKTASYQIEVKAVPTHEVTWSVNGTTSSENYQEGATITFPTGLADIDVKTFVGWVTDAIEGTTDEDPDFVTSATMGEEALTFYAVFADKTPGTQTNVTDVLTSALTGVTGTGSYSDWSGKTAKSAAVYAGNSAKNSTDAIQMRSNNSNSGIISTTSGGTLKSVSVTWIDGNTSGRSLDIYGSNTAYSAATDLYDSKKQGTKLGSITYDTSTSLTISGDYAYVGLRSNSGALYLDDISIEWTTGTPDTYSAYCTTVAADTRLEPQLSFSVDEVNANISDTFVAPTLNTATDFDGTVEYESSDESVAQIMDSETGDLMLLKEGTTTITATFAGNDNFKRGSASYTLNVTDNRIATTTTVENIVLDIADYATLTQLIPVVKDAEDNIIDCTYENFPPKVSYEIVSDESYLIGSLDNNSGEITLNEVVGTATLKAYYNAFRVSNTYKPSECTFTITVVDPNAPGAVNNPFTVTQAIDEIKAGNTGSYYVSGIISQISSTSVISGGKLTYYISDDGTTTNQLQVYHGMNFNNTEFTSVDDIALGDIVVVYGPFTYYNNKTPEINDGNYLVSLTKTPSIIVDTNTIEATADGADGTITVTYNNLTNYLSEVQFVASDGETAATYDWLVAEIDTSDDTKLDYIIEENTSTEVRMAYMKIYAVGDEGEASALITITQEGYVAPEETIGNFVKVTSNDDLTSGQYLIVYEDGSVAFDGSLETLDASENTIGVTIENGEIAATTTNVKSVFSIDVTAGTIQSASGLYIGVARNSNELKTSEDAETYTHTFSIDEEENAVISAVFEGSTMTLRYNSASNQARFRYYKSGQQAIQLYKFVADAEAVEVAVTAAGYATYCSESDLDFSNTAITAYKAKITGTDVSFKEVKQVPAGEGVLLKANEGTYAVPVAAYAAANTDNAFIGVTEETVVDPGIFVLLNGNKGVGFYKTTKAFTVGANTAYLPALAGGAEGARSFIGFDNMVTAIEGIAAEKMLNGEVYNLQGQRMVAPQKGLYIVNGKKVVIK